MYCVCSGFLLLVAPFYDHCNGHRLKKQLEGPAEESPVIEEVAIATDSIALVNDTVSSNTAQAETDTLQNQILEKPSLFEIGFNFIDDEDSESALEIMNFEIEILKDLNAKDFQVDFSKMKRKQVVDFVHAIFFHIKNISFGAIIIVTFLTSFFAIRKKIKTIYRLSKVNLTLLCVTIIGVFSEGMFEDIRQIKWGYYAFFIIQICILIVSKKLSVKQHH